MAQRQGLEERILAHEPVDKMLPIIVQRGGNGAAGQPGARRAANANTTPVLSLSCGTVHPSCSPRIPDSRLAGPRQMRFSGKPGAPGTLAANRNDRFEAKQGNCSLLHCDRLPRT